MPNDNSTMGSRFDRKFSQVKLIVHPTRGWIDGRNAIIDFIQTEIDRAVGERDREWEKKIREATTYDHSECPIKETCIGYQDCVSDIENGVIQNLITKQS